MSLMAEPCTCDLAGIPKGPFGRCPRHGSEGRIDIEGRIKDALDYQKAKFREAIQRLGTYEPTLEPDGLGMEEWPTMALEKHGEWIKREAVFKILEEA